MVAVAMCAAPQASAAVSARDVFKIYKEGSIETVALRGVSFTAQPGECVAIVGPSGSGKSTLLNLIGGLDFPTAGQVWVGGQNMAELSEASRAQLRRRYLGFVFQDNNLIPFLSALENVALPLRLAGVRGPETVAQGLLAEVGLAERLHHRPSALSGGEQQRVGIACALANQAQVLLADEPTGELDSQTASSIMELLIELNQSRGTTLIIVTHDPAIAAFAGRTVQVRDGLIVNINRGAEHG